METETEIYNDIIMGKDYDKLFTLVSLHNDNLLSRFLEFVKDVAKNHSIDDDLYPVFFMDAYFS